MLNLNTTVSLQVKYTSNIHEDNYHNWVFLDVEARIPTHLPLFWFDSSGTAVIFQPMWQERLQLHTLEQGFSNYGS